MAGCRAGRDPDLARRPSMPSARTRWPRAIARPTTVWPVERAEPAHRRHPHDAAGVRWAAGSLSFRTYGSAGDSPRGPTGDGRGDPQL